MYAIRKPFVTNHVPMLMFMCNLGYFVRNPAFSLTKRLKALKRLNVVVTRSIVFGVKCIKNRFVSGLRPDPLESLQRFPDP